MTTATPPAHPVSPAAPVVADRLASIEKRLDALKPGDKDRWDKFEKMSGALWAVVTTARHGVRLASIDLATGRTRVRGENVDHVEALQTIGGRLMALARGTYRRVDHPGDQRFASCARANGSEVAVALAGDARTLYVARSPATLEAPGSAPGVRACPWSGGSTPFRPSVFAYGRHGPIVSGIALVGTRVLVFTRRV